MTNPIKNKTIILGVTGSIAAYKAAALASNLHQAGAQIDVILTQSAQRFITSLSFQSVTVRKAYTDDDLWGEEGHITHIGLAHAADLMVIAPATANTLAKLANGICDNLLTVTALAASCPLLIAPAMDSGMYSHSATQVNIEVLKKRNVSLIGPVSGHLASGLEGLGRMVEPAQIIGHIRWLLGRDGPLSGKKVVISAGSTREPIDPVRFITNRSSGKQGFAIAQSALDVGADVTLVTGPTCIEAPIGIQQINVQSAAEMLAAVLGETNTADVLIMAGAVADFRPVLIAEQKINKISGIPEIQLEATKDILTAVAEQRIKSGHPRYSIGFAAESHNVLKNAQTKLRQKHLDLIVVNDISAADAGFEVDTNKVTLLFADGHCEDLPVMKKSEVADVIIQQVCQWF